MGPPRLTAPATAHSDERPTLTLVVLSSDQEAEILEYVNWDDGHCGLASNLGFVLDKARDGWADVQFEQDPERFIIQILDKVHRHRRVHRVMLAVGHHSRTLSHAYTIGRKPVYLDKQFGKLAGVAASMVEDIGELADACRDIALKTATPDQSKLVARIKRDSAAAYYGACRAYVAARTLCGLGEYRGPKPSPAPSLPHVCRVSAVYPCPCGHAHEEA